MTPSKIRPVGNKILVLPDLVEQETASGIVVVTDINLEKEMMAQTEGIIIAVGNTAWADQKEAWAKVGDRVIFSKYTGHIRTGKDGKVYRILNDLDVGAVIDD